MSNYSNTLNIHQTVISTRSQESTAKGLEELMSFDLDYSENEECFRKDTLKKGFRSEAHRIAAEKTKKPVNDQSDLESRVNEILAKVFNSSYYGDWEYVVVPMVDDEYTIVVSYIG
jgi:hypothetical protein